MKKLLAAVIVLAVSTAQAATIHVDAANCPGPGDGSVGDPYCSIQTAIDNAVDTDEVIVAPGTYFETIDFLGKAVWLHSSDGAAVTTISANGPLEANTVVTCESGEGPDTVLEGFTITGGTGTFFEAEPDIFRFVGGGMLNTGSSSPTVTNCTFSGNTAEIAGGMGNDTNSNPTVTNCTFIGNSVTDTGGGMASRNNNPVVTNCTFSGNFADNSGGGMDYENSSPTITNCTFSGNSTNGSGGGTALYDNSTPTITNCTFNGNSAFTGGGIWTSDAFGGHSETTVVNTITWGNNPDQIVDEAGATTTVNYSDVQDGWPGTGNIDADPLFVDPAGGDLHLLPGSPCIDAGNNWAIAGRADTDLDGNPRFAADENDFDPGCGIPVVVDMGAYEYQGDPFPVKFGDINGDGIVGIVDFLALLGNWGPCEPGCCLADLDIDGDVGITDFLLLLGNWG